MRCLCEQFPSKAVLNEVYIPISHPYICAPTIHSPLASPPHKSPSHSHVKSQCHPPTANPRILGRSPPQCTQLIVSTMSIVRLNPIPPTKRTETYPTVIRKQPYDRQVSILHTKSTHSEWPVRMLPGHGGLVYVRHARRTDRGA